jgi:periplasmic divalent cation tolerance protein
MLAGVRTPVGERSRMSAETMIVLTTCGDAADAEALAARLVEQRLAACVNAVSHVTSIYRWQDGVQRDQETLLIIKTTATRFSALEQTIREHSLYELPEVIAIPVEAGFPPYLAWVAESTSELKD